MSTYVIACTSIDKFVQTYSCTLVHVLYNTVPDANEYKLICNKTKCLWNFIIFTTFANKISIYIIFTIKIAARTFKSLTQSFKIFSFTLSLQTCNISKVLVLVINYCNFHDEFFMINLVLLILDNYQQPINILVLYNCTYSYCCWSREFPPRIPCKLSSVKNISNDLLVIYCIN